MFYVSVMCMFCKSPVMTLLGSLTVQWCFITAKSFKFPRGQSQNCWRWTFYIEPKNCCLTWKTFSLTMIYMWIPIVFEYFNKIEWAKESEITYTTFDKQSECKLIIIQSWFSYWCTCVSWMKVRILELNSLSVHLKSYIIRSSSSYWCSGFSFGA